MKVGVEERKQAIAREISKLNGNSESSSKFEIIKFCLQLESTVPQS